MKGYRKPSGVYIEMRDAIPVSDDLVEVALRPSPDHIFTDTWRTAPLDPAVCWRVQTAAETSAEKDGDLQAFLDSTGGKVVKAVVTVLIQKGVCTLADIRSVYRNV